MKDADIDARLSSNVRENIWNKFYFISVSASLTTYYDVSFNAIVETDERRNMTIGMAKEFIQVAKAEGIDLGEDAIENIVSRTEVLPKDTTTSMHSDFIAGHKTEVDNLTGVVVQLAHKHKIEIPLYEKVYKTLKEKEQKNNS